MQYALENALYQWQQGERLIRDSAEAERFDLERATALVGDELRRRLGSSFELRELIDLYAAGTDWAEEIAGRARAGGDAGAVVDAAFGRYSREAADYAGGRMRYRAKESDG